MARRASLVLAVPILNDLAGPGTGPAFCASARYPGATSTREVTVEVNQNAVDSSDTVPALCDTKTHSATLLVLGVFVPGNTAAVGVVSNDTLTSQDIVATTIVI